MPPPELDRIADLVKRGLVPMAEANSCLKAWQVHQQAGRAVSLADLFVRARLLTPTQGALVTRTQLVERQPFPNYRLLREIGEGGMAVVFEATYVPVNARVALKILDTAFCLQEPFRLRFKREAGILLALEHENIVEGREYATHDGVDFYAMAFVDGISVVDLIHKGVRLSERLCLDIALQVASALDHMAKKGIVHRDVKPANLVLDHDGTVRIIDFGLAKVMAGMRQDTSVETTVGTIEYMSPEQAQNRSDVDARADVYSLGCSLFHMVTGALPFNGEPEEIMYGHVKRPVEFTPAQRARVSPQVQYLIRKAMAKSPDDRHAGGQAFIDEVKAICAPILARPIDLPDEVLAASVEAAPIDLAAPARPRAPVLRRPDRPGHRRMPGRGRR